MVMSTTSVRLGIGAIALAFSGAGVVAASSPASATQDTSCMRAGMATLKQAGLFTTVARSGLPIGAALSLGVTPRPGADLSGVPDPIPLPVLLADHRAGIRSLFIYPWC
jgi:hypothetical protein